MNMISFANFDKLDNQKSFFPETDLEEKAEEFSAILSNITVALEPAQNPAGSLQNEEVKDDLDVSLEIPASKSADSFEFDTKLFEIQKDEPKTAAQPNGETPAVETLWEGKQPIFRQQKDKFKNENVPFEKPTTPIKQILQGNPNTIAKTRNSFPSPIKVNPSEPSPNMEILIDDSQNFDAPIKVALETNLLQNPVSYDLNLLAAKEIDSKNKVTFIKAAPDFENSAAIEQKTDSSGQNHFDLSKLESIEQPSTVIVTEGSSTIPLKENEANSFKPLAETKTEILPPRNEFRDSTEIKPQKNDLPQRNDLDPIIPPPTIETEEDPTSQGGVVFDQNDFPIHTDNSISKSPVKTQPENEIRQPILNNNENFIPVVEATVSEIQTTLKIDRRQAENSDLPQKETGAILNNFDRFFKGITKNPVEANNAETIVKAEVKSTKVETFEDLSRSIKSAFPGLLKETKNAEKTPKNASFDASTNWSKNAPETTSPTISQIERFSQNLNLSGEIHREVELKPDEFGDSDTIDFSPSSVSPSNQSETLNFVGNPVITVQGAAPKSSEILIEQPKFNVSRDFKFDGNIEKTKFDAPQNDSNIAVSFDRFIEKISKQNPPESVKNIDSEPVKMLEQINPHLIELAAKVENTKEKQTLKMRLNPAELGAVEIKLERNESGTLNAYFKTETDSARAALSQNLDQLRETLQNAGWKIGQMEISYGSNSSNADQHRESNSRPSQTFENFGFRRNSDTPEGLIQNSSSRLLSLLA